MAQVTVEFGEVIIEIEAVDALWALRSQLEIPLAHIRSAACAADPRAAGTATPEAAPAADILSAARLVRQASAVFWEVRDPAKAVVIDLADECCARLVVEVDDPTDVVARINRALAREGH